MRTVVGIATHEGRIQSLPKTIASLRNQCDEIFVYDNSKNKDYSSHAKFYILHQLTEPVYFFSCDDDLIYPPDYVETLRKAIEKHKCIVTAHGRILVSGQNSYYHGRHICFRHNAECADDVILDTAGTGVTAFRTDYFNPVELYKYPTPRMADLAFSLEAAKQEKKIICIKHPYNWVKSLNLKGIASSYSKEKRRDESKQVEVMNQIIALKQ